MFSIINEILPVELTITYEFLIVKSAHLGAIILLIMSTIMSFLHQYFSNMVDLSFLMGAQSCCIDNGAAL